jgi:hypothetical protein
MVYHFMVACGSQARNLDTLAVGITELATAAAKNHTPQRADNTF